MHAAPHEQLNPHARGSSYDYLSKVGLGALRWAGITSLNLLAVRSPTGAGARAGHKPVLVVTLPSRVQPERASLHSRCGAVTQGCVQGQLGVFKPSTDVSTLTQQRALR